MNAPRSQLARAHRIVVKVGTHVLTHDGQELALGRLTTLVESVARLRKRGLQMIFVTSGSVAVGMQELGMKKRPRSLGVRQACAAVGQGHLIGIFTRAFAHLNVVAAQVLLTQEDLGERDRALCLRTTLTRLMEMGAVPVVNENDSVSVRELMDYRREDGEPDAGIFGDNDMLSAIVATHLDADLLVMLTNVDGVYDSNPKSNPDARRYSVIEHIDDTIKAGVRHGLSAGGTGGMASKLKAAELATSEGTTAVIASGFEPDIVERIVDGEDVGTLLTPTADRGARWRRIAISEERQGALIVNEGALRALCQEKASLLPVGVIGVEGDFANGDVVEIRDGSGRVHGRGLVNYKADACRKLQGHNSEVILEKLGYKSYDALVTRDNLVMGIL